MKIFSREELVGNGPNGYRNGEKNEINTVFKGYPDIVKDVTVLNKLKSNDDRLVRCQVASQKKGREN